MRIAGFFCLIVVAGVAGTLAAAAAATNGCAPAYVVPYSDQCDFEYKKIAHDASQGTVQGAFAACERAQQAALPCLSSKDVKLRNVAATALYRDVTEEGEIATFAQNYPYATAYLRERGDVLRVVRANKQISDAAYAKELADIDNSRRDIALGSCTLKVRGDGKAASDLAHARRYGDLSTLLAGKAAQYRECSAIAGNAERRSFVTYLSSIATEESGRAAQAAGQKAVASSRYNACLRDVTGAMPAANANLKTALGQLRNLCAGRLAGKIAVNQPHPLDQLGPSSATPAPAKAAGSPSRIRP